MLAQDSTMAAMPRAALSGMMMPIIHIGVASVAAASFITYCWRTSVQPVQIIRPKKTTDDTT